MAQAGTPADHPSIPVAAALISCADPASPEELAAALAAVRLAHRDGDAKRASAAFDQVLTDLACVDFIVTPALAAAVHRAAAVAAWMSGEAEPAVQAAHSALALDELFDLCADLGLAPEHRLCAAWEAGRARVRDARRSGLRTERGVSLPPGGQLYVEGLPAAGRPFDRPVIAQLTDGAGGLIWSGYLRPEASLPLDRLVARGHARPPRLSRALAAGAGGGAVAAAGLLGGAIWMEQRAHGLAERAVGDGRMSLDERAEWASAVRWANGLGYAAQGLGLASLLGGSMSLGMWLANGAGAPVLVLGAGAVAVEGEF